MTRKRVRARTFSAAFPELIGRGAVQHLNLSPNPGYNVLMSVKERVSRLIVLREHALQVQS